MRMRRYPALQHICLDDAAVHVLYRHLHQLEVADDTNSPPRAPDLIAEAQPLLALDFSGGAVGEGEEVDRREATVEEGKQQTADEDGGLGVELNAQENGQETCGASSDGSSGVRQDEEDVARGQGADWRQVDALAARDVDAFVSRCVPVPGLCVFFGQAGCAMPPALAACCRRRPCSRPIVLLVDPTRRMSRRRQGVLARGKHDCSTHDCSGAAAGGTAMATFV
jgi:hypothetical protein